ncbi:unnamed protein product [Parnassius apollo]|uniref:(apollo) hypothetical protein n=1 Tax=Parnassius apollo TaxID=110799 RepID=A0A8S3W6B2_PARAO|nr:unnamed protein product [Parnassius apollo]
MRKKSKNLNNSDDECNRQEKKYDEDVSFCEMLISMLNLLIDQKHYAKIEILNALNTATKYSPLIQNVMPPRFRQSSSSHSSYNPNMTSPYPNTPSPYPIYDKSPPDPSPQTQYTPSRNPSIIPQSPPDQSPQTQYTISRNPSIIPQSQPDPSPQTQYTPSRNPSNISQSHTQSNTKNYRIIAGSIRRI